MKKITFLSAICLIFALLVTGCKKDDDSTPADNPTVPADLFCFTAVENNVDVALVTEMPTRPKAQFSLQYSLNGTDWHDFVVDQTVVNLPNAGDKVYIKSKGVNTTFSTQIATATEISTDTFNISIFTLSHKATVSGNILYLLNGENPSQAQMGENAFMAMFGFSLNLVDASALVLPDRNLTTLCFNGLFYNCRNLVGAPKLPATQLAPKCYQEMFTNCSSLTTAPDLPAMTAMPYCYYGMFDGCKALTEAPAIDLLVADTNCCEGMFYNCSAMVKGPQLYVTELAPHCFCHMFGNCTSLTSLTCTATLNIGAGYLDYWMSNVTTSGVLYAQSGADWTGMIPSTWRVETLNN